MTMIDPGNPNTSSFAVAAIRDGSVFDPETRAMGAAVYYERLDVQDPDPNMAARIANDRLRALGGAVSTMTIKCVPQPWLTPGDVIAVEYNGTRVVAQVAAWTLDVGSRTEMTVQLRAWRVNANVGLPVWAPDVSDFPINAATPVGVDDKVDRYNPAFPQPPQSPVETS